MNVLINNLDENISNKIEDICESLLSGLLINEISGQKNMPWDYNISQLNDGFNIRYKNVDIYFYNDHYSAYVDYVDSDVKEILKLSPKISYSIKRKELQLKDMDYITGLDILQNVLPEVLIL